MNKLEKELVRFSKSRQDETVFSPYILESFLKTVRVKSSEGQLVYGLAISEDQIPMLLTADSHAMLRISQRLGLCYADVVMAAAIEAIENNNELGNRIVDAFDAAENRPYGMVALWLETLDIFCYLHVYQDEIHLATVISGKPVYFVNSTCELICRVTKENVAVFDIQNTSRFCASDSRNFKESVSCARL